MIQSPATRDVRSTLCWAFRLWYVIAMLPLATLAMGPQLWYWSSTASYSSTMFDPFSMLLLAWLAVSAASYIPQERLVCLLETAETRPAAAFATAFYRVHVQVACLLSGILLLLGMWFQWPWISIPLLFWWMPYPLLVGLLIGWRLQQLGNVAHSLRQQRLSLNK